MLQKQVVLQTSRFNVERITDESTELDRHIVRHSGSVVIIPILSDGSICLIRNYRISVEDTLFELPAGTLEQGESPENCARRELEEETGYTAGRIEAIVQFFAAPGIMDEKMHCFLATDLVAGNPNREPNERIENHPIQLDAAIDMIQENLICDAKTICGLLFYDHFLRS